MLRFLALVLAIGSVTPADDPKKKPTEKEVVKELEGEWAVVALESEGRKAPAEAMKGMSWVIKGTNITGSDPDSGWGKMGFALFPDKSPAEIDITLIETQKKDDKQIGKVMAGIYELKDGQLRICLNEDAKRRPKEFKTDGVAGSGMITLEKKKAK